MNTDRVTELVNELKKLNNTLVDYEQFLGRIHQKSDTAVVHATHTLVLSSGKYVINIPVPGVESEHELYQTNLRLREESFRYVEIIIERLKRKIAETEQAIRNS